MATEKLNGKRVAPKPSRHGSTIIGGELRVDVPLESARADDFDALLLPGGVINPDKLRQDERAVRFVKSFFQAGKPVAAICHGPWMLVEADVVRGRTVTSWPSLHTDLRNAGADWVDRKVVTDEGLVTSRKPDDISCVQQEDDRGVWLILYDRIVIAQIIAWYIRTCCGNSVIRDPSCDHV